MLGGPLVRHRDERAWTLHPLYLTLLVSFWKARGVGIAPGACLPGPGERLGTSKNPGEPRLPWQPSKAATARDWSPLPWQRFPSEEVEKEEGEASSQNVSQ